MAQQRTQRAFAGIAGVLGLLGVLNAVAQWAGMSFVQAPVPALSFIAGVLLLGSAALAWRHTPAPAWLAPSVAAMFASLLGLGLVLNGHLALTAVPVAVLFLHIALGPNAALAVSAALLAMSLVTIEFLEPGPSPLPVWRLWGAGFTSLVIAQWLSRLQLQLSHLNHQAVDGMENLLKALGEELTRTRRDHRDAERALWTAKEAESRVQALMSLTLDAMESVASGIMIVDDRKRVTAFNRRFAELLDLPIELLERRPNLSEVVAFQALRGDFGQDFDQIDAGLARWVQSEIQGREDLGLQRYVRRTAAGKVLEFHTLRSSTGQVVRTVNDVTAHQVLTDQLASALAERDQQIDSGRALQVDLQMTLDQLRQTEEQLQQELVKSREALNLQANFVASVSHELRTPLNGISGMSELLAETPLDGVQTAHLEDLRSAARQLRMLIDELLDLSKVSAPGFRLESSVFDLYEPLEDSLISARMMARGKPVEVRFEPQGASIPVRGDPLRLGQIANNLLSNAVKFTDAGAVSITASWQEKPGDAQRVVLGLVVSDTGRGIDPSLHHVIFEPFHQGEASTNRTHGGTGLGLSLTRQLVSAMGGTIEMDSELGAGTTFRVQVQLELAADQDNAAAMAAAPPPQSLVRLDGVRVLVADDNKVNQKLVGLWLVAAGAQVTAVFDGAAALRAATEQDFDVILMDVAMPEMTGLDAVRALRRFAGDERPALQRRARVPVIGVTAMARPQDREMCRDAGMTAHQSKPISRGELLRAMQQVLATEPALAGGSA